MQNEKTVTRYNEFVADMPSETNYENKCIGLILGNGNFARDIHDRIEERFERHVVVALLEEELSTARKSRISLHAKPSEYLKIINHLRKNDVTHLVFAGDLGIYRAIPMGIAPVTTESGAAALPINLDDLSVSDILRYAKVLLNEANFSLLHLGEIFEDLRPREGIIVSGEFCPDTDYLASLVKQSMNELQDQPFRFIRHSIAYDDRICIDKEEECTDELLKRVKNLRRTPDSKRILAKLCPPNIPSTIDAPVIGPDTIEHCKIAGVQAVLLDSNHGIIAFPEKTKSLALEYSISIIGVNTNQA